MVLDLGLLLLMAFYQEGLIEHASLRYRMDSDIVGHREQMACLPIYMVVYELAVESCNKDP